MNIDHESIIKAILHKENIVNYTLSNSHTLGTNVRTIEVKFSNTTITFTMDDESGKIIDRKTSNAFSTSIIEPPTKVNDLLTVSATLYFELYEKYFVGGKIIDCAPIKLIIDDENSNYITGFEIIVQDVEDDSIKEANEKATRLVNYLGILQNQPLRHKRPRVRTHLKGKTTSTISFGMDAVLVKSYDLDMNKAMTLLNKDSIFNQKLAHAQEGIRALSNNDFAKAISEFWIVTEDENLAIPKNYTNLRHAVNHKQIDGKDAIEDLKNNFGINMNRGDHLNINNPEIQDILEKEALDMQKLVFNYLNNELLSKSFV